MKTISQEKIKTRGKTSPSFRVTGLSVIVLCAFLVLMISPLRVSAEQPSSSKDKDAVRELTLQQCLLQTLADNYDIVLAEIDFQSVQENLKREKAGFDPVSNFNSGYRTSETKLSAESSYIYNGLESYDADSLSFDASLGQSFKTGGNYDFRFSTNRNTGTFITEPGPDYDADGTPDDLDGDGLPDYDKSQEYNTSFALSLAHPLLRNFGIVVNTGNILIAENNEQAALFSFQQAIISTVSNVHNRYWELVLAIKNVDVIEKSLRLAQDFLDLTKARVELGTLPPIEIVIAEAEVANREEAIINAINMLKNSEDNLRQTMNVPSDDVFWNQTIVPVTDLEFEIVELDYDTAIETAFRNRLDYQQALLNVKNREIGLTMAKSSALPGLDFNASVTVSDVDNDFAESVSNSLDRNSYTFYSGLSLQVPWRNRAALAAKAQANYALQRAKIEQRKLEDLVRLEVRRALRELENNTKQISAARKSLELSRQKLEAEQKKYEIGISTSFNVIAYQKDLAQAETNETAAIVAYKKALVNLYQTLGNTLDKNYITLDPSGERANLTTE